MVNMKKFFVVLFMMIIITVQSFVLVLGSDFNADDTVFDEVTVKLDALGIIERYDDPIKLDETVTRGEMITIVVRLLGLGDLGGSTDQSALVDIAVNSGIISGYGNGELGLDDSITYEQAVKMLVNAVGYDVYAQGKGGYPTGYLIVGAENGITKGVYANVGEQINRKIAASLAYNTLNVDLMERVGFGNDERFSVIRNRTLLTERLNVEENSGILTATSETELVKAKSTLKDDEVKIGDSIYKIGKTDAKKYLGYEVDFYAKESEGRNYKELIFIEKKPNYNNTITVKADSIDRENTTRRKFVYWQDEGYLYDAKELNISPIADMIYNGKAYPGFEPIHMKPEIGEVVLLDRDNDGVYDILFVKSYYTIVVDRISSKTIYGKYSDSNSLVLDKYDNTYSFSIIKDGNPIEFGNIKEWDVLFVAETINEDEKFISVIVANNRVEGIVTEVSSDYKQIVIGDNTYEIETSFRDYLLSQNVRARGLLTSDKSYFYLDADGRVAASDSKSLSQEKYGYLFGIDLADGMEKEIKFEIFTIDQEWIIYKAADKVELNNSLKKADEVAKSELLSVLGGNGKINRTIRQLVKYETNNNGDISAIKTAQDIATITTDPKEHFTKTALENAKFRDQNYAFDSKIFVRNIKTFAIPIDDNKVPTDDRNHYTVLEHTFFDYNIRHYIEGYDVVLGEPGAAVYYRQVADVEQPLESNREPILLIDRVTTVVHNNDTVQKVSGIHDGAEKEFFCINDNMLTGFKRGDVIQFELNGANEIIQVSNTKLIDIENILIQDKGGYDAAPRFVTGYVSDINRTIKRLEVDVMSELVLVDLSWARTNIYVYEQGRDKVYIGNIDDILIDDIVFLRLSHERLYDVVVYKR